MNKINRNFLKILSLLFALCILLMSSVVSVGAVSYSNDVSTVSDSILLVNMDTGQEVFSKDADSKRYPASTTKIMTYIIAVENIEDLDNTQIPIKQSVLDILDGTGSSLAGVESHVGESMSAIDLLYSMMVPSGNDAAVVLADYVGNGSIDAFVEMMNEKAQELGCENTNFVNPDGLHDDDHYTTARDLYKITTYALTLPRFSEITDTTTYYCEDDDTPLITTNYLIDASRGGNLYYTYAKGIKTGTTNEAGRCLVTTATADGYSYMAILLHAPYEEGVNEDEYGTMTDAADLFRWALTSLELNTVASEETPVCEETVNLAWGKDSVLLVPETDLSVIVPTDYEDSDIVIETDIPDSVDAPVDTDTVIGTATVYYQDDDGTKQELATVNLISSEKIERSGFLYVISVVSTVLQSYWFIILIGAIIIILLIYFIISRISKARRKKNRKVKHYRNL
ncbi:MAG: D-alanyl-D-alanine carboxypeptidase [Clostridiales bacterium]|nr:D-alanyl-D-alanine carboxypeptidase [Clostridiales bacterium]